MDHIYKPWYRFVRDTAKYLGLRPLGRIEVIGEKNVPKSGPVIITPNHVSHLDPPLVAAATKRVLRIMAKEELFEKWLLGPLIRSCGAFPVRRGENDTEAIRKAIKMLELGEALLMFPEGKRGDGTKLLPISPGIAMLAKRTHAQVVPTAVIGTHLSLPKGASFPKRAKLKVVFGKPITYEDVVKKDETGQERAFFANYLRNQLAELCKKNGFPVEI